MPRTTIRDIATAAGVSPAAVSFALNGKPGVSEATRTRVISVAADLGWTPNAAARALSADRADAVGLVIARPGTSLAAERFYFEFIMGVQGALAPASSALMLQVVPSVSDEIGVYRAWASQRRVDGVIVVDPRTEDPRPGLLAELGMPFVMVGEDTRGGSAIAGDEEGVARLVAGHLVDIGCRSMAYICPDGSIRHSARRMRAFTEFGKAAGMDVRVLAEESASESAGGAAVAALVASGAPCDAVVFDNEVLAVGGLGAVRDAGFEPGRDVALVSLEDSAICRALSPALTAVHREPAHLGGQAARLLSGLISGAPPTTVPLDRPELRLRASSSSWRPLSGGARGARER